jgi:outer membrane protein assembly factor BamB
MSSLFMHTITNVKTHTQQHWLVCLLLASLAVGTVIGPAEAKRRKPAVKPTAEQVTAETRHPAAAPAWQTAQGPSITAHLRGQLSGFLLADSAIQQLIPLEDSVIGLTRQGSVVRAKASGAAITTLWRTAAGSSSPGRVLGRSIALQGNLVWACIEPIGLDKPQLQAIDIATGQIKATVTLPVAGNVFAFGANRLLIIQDNGHAVALEITSQAVAWDVDLKSPVAGSPWITDEGIYLADAAGIARKLNPQTGQIIWEFGLGGPYEASPVLTPEPASPWVVLPSQVGSVFAINAATGQRVMSHTLPEGTPFLASAVANGHTVIAADEDGLVFALERQSNRRLWQQRLRGRVEFSLLAAGHTVLVSQVDGRVNALNADTGKVDWTVPIPGILSTAPVLTRQQLWLGTQDGRLFFMD